MLIEIMKNLSIVFGFICVAVALIALFGVLPRNHWVLHERLRILRTDPEMYRKLPSYDSMVWRFWVWKIEDFIPDDPTVPECGSVRPPVKF